MQRQNIYIRKIRNKHTPQEDDVYPFSLPVIKRLRELEFSTSVTYIVGENGSGKSTILEAIAQCLGLNPEGGSKNFRFHTQESHSNLNEKLVCVRSDLTYRDAYFFRAESFYNVSTEIDRLKATGSYGHKSLHQMSHGEGFMSLISNRLTGKGIYIFDEPEAALSFQNQLRFLCWIKQVVEKGAQVIITTHSPVVLSYPQANIYVIDDGEITLQEYTDCYIYKDMMGFIMNRDLYMKEMELL